MLKIKYVTVLFLVMQIVIFASLLFYTDPVEHISLYIVSTIPLFLIYFIFCIAVIRKPEQIAMPLTMFIGVAILIRIILLFSSPLLSDDVYRYLWDGRVSAHGVNPYSYAPQEEPLSELQDDTIFPNINFPEIATVYPPLAQFFFLINVFLGNTILSWKLILFISELILVFFLYRLVQYFAINPYRLLIIIFNPLLIIETYHSGHVDILGVLFLWIAIYYFFTERQSATLLSIVASVLVKVLPLLSALPFLFKQIRLKFLFVLCCAILAVLPFTLDGTIPMAGSVSYANRWAFNNIFYTGITQGLMAAGFETTELFRFFINGRLEVIYVSPALVYKFTALVALLLLIYDQMKKLSTLAEYKSIACLQVSFFITGLILLLNPTVHPWYLVWIIPFLIFVPNWSWLIFTFLIQISYYVLIDYRRNNIWQENIWVLLLQYVPFLLLLLYEYIDQRKIRGWFSSSTS